MIPSVDNEILRIVLTVFWIFGGLGLFLYGIDMMGNSLRKAAGTVLRKGLGFLTRSRFHGLLTGTVITGLLQSSSATTVMVVGFISAGLLTFPQSIGVILGANIGSTITPLITAMSLDELAIPVIGVGFLMNFLSRRRVSRQLGMAFMGFGMLFLGLMLMKEAVRGYSDTIEGCLAVCTQSGVSGQLIAFFVAMILTAVVQSSALTVAMVQALALAGAISEIDIAIPIIVGANVGTCITAMLASIKSSRSAKKAAIAHLVFNIVGVFTTIALYKFYVAYIPKTSSSLPHQIAIAHVAIKVVQVGIILPFTKQFAWIVNRIVPGVDKLDAAPLYLDTSDLSDPRKALSNVSNEIRRMCTMCLEVVGDAVDAFFAGDEIQRELVLKREDLTDDLYDSIAGYVLEISKRDLSADFTNQPHRLMHVMGDVERIGDHAENIVEVSQAFGKDNALLSGKGESDIRSLMSDIVDIGRCVDLLFESATPEGVAEVMKLREAVYSNSRDMLDRHEKRLADGKCSVIAGIVFVDLVTNLKRVANHLRNIAASLGNGVKPDTAEV